jgi:PAS domain S-box-containing protein
MSSQAVPIQSKPLFYNLLFYHLFEQASLGIAIEDLDGKVLLANPALCSMLGYTQDELCVMSCSQFANPEDSKDDWALFQQLRAGGIDNYSLEKRYVRKDGVQLWGRLNVSVLKDADRGSAPLVFAFVEDIDERKRAEEALRGSDERFRLAARTAKMYAYEWDVANDKVTRSEDYANVLGYGDPQHQLTRQQLMATIHPEDRTLFITSADEVGPQNPIQHLTYRVVRPDGSVVWLEKSARGSFDRQGKLVRMIGMVADVTDRKQVEQAQRESEEKLRLLLDSTAEAICGIDLEGRCTFCNPACLRILGYERVDQLLGKNMHDLIQYSRANGVPFPADQCRINLAIRTGEAVHADDEVFWRANGTSFPVEYWSYPQRRGQEVLGAVVAFNDISNRKLTEATLASVSRRLIEAQEGERSRIGRELHDDIGQRVALLSVELQQLHEDPPDLPEVRLRIAELQKQATEIAADVQSLSHELHSSKLQYLGVAAAMRGFCQEFAKQQRVDILFQAQDLPNSLPPDISLGFFRVLQEALHNSAKHSGVRHFEVRLWGAPGEIHLTVSDAGVGFDREAAKASQGLGLISMEERLKLLNGTFSIESQLHRGTTIHARVPFNLESDSMQTAG